MKKSLFIPGIILLLALGFFVIANVCANVAAYMFLSGYWLWLISFAHICVIVCVLKTVAGRDNSLAKYSKIVFLLLFPPLSFLLVCLFQDMRLVADSRTELKNITNTDSEKSKKSGKQNCTVGAKSFELLSNRRGSFPSDKNHVRLFSCGKEAFDALKSALADARTYIALEFMIVSSGILLDKLKEVLIKKLRENVKVFIVYDRFATKKKFKKRDRDELRQAGAEIRAFDCKTGLFFTNILDHRKIAVIDGKTAFTGGVNIGDEYAGFFDPFGKWRDFLLMISGRAVGEYVRMFDSMWRYLNGAPIALAHDSGRTSESGENTVAVFSNSGADSKSLMPELLVSLIVNARKSVWIATPYLILDEIVANALKTALSSGVEVIVAVPGIPDKKLPYIVTMNNLRKLVQCGAKGFAYSPGFLHTKYIIVDGETVLTGSVNLNQRSLYSDFESVMLVSGSAAGDIAGDFCNIIADSVKRDAITFGKMQTAAVWAASLLQPLF